MGKVLVTVWEGAQQRLIATLLLRNTIFSIIFLLNTLT